MAVAEKKNVENTLTGIRKAAILLILLGEEGSPEIIKHMTKQDVMRVTTEIANIDSVYSSTIERVCEEFMQLAEAQSYVATGGLDTAQSMLEKAFDANVARELVEKIRSMMNVRGFNTLQKADSTQLVNFLIKEHPQTIALILSYLKPSQTADVLAEFPEDLRLDVAYRIATLGKISPQLLRQVEEVIDSLAETVISEDLSKTGGASALAQILNSANKMTEKSILGYLEEIDPDMAIQVKSQMFVFEDLVLIDDRGIQKNTQEHRQERLGAGAQSSGRSHSRKDSQKYVRTCCRAVAGRFGSDGTGSSEGCGRSTAQDYRDCQAA